MTLFNINAEVETYYGLFRCISLGRMIKQTVIQEGSGKENDVEMNKNQEENVAEATKLRGSSKRKRKGNNVSNI